ncbi:hypothetical protein E2562_035063 [Oryza meyeriana var. granulata]|uniref:Transmembrane protein n=1 Tax=Oryza meyeriana var. granulata TaxID=110450 RepID=A0A6G1CWM8_9ORYZ|nr:hypothetical protein E2562_035063 [Oryza meyeriana var. granulata]
MAHVGLATALLVLYRLYRLLADFLQPLQWALLFSILLWETQRALVAFWEPPLCGGRSTAVLALPLTVVRSCGAMLADARATLLRRPLLSLPSFPRLLRWLASSFLFLLLLERLGTTAALVLLALSLAFFAASPKPSSFLSRAASSRIAGRTPSSHGLLPSLGLPSTTSPDPSLPTVAAAAASHRSPTTAVAVARVRDLREQERLGEEEYMA